MSLDRETLLKAKRGDYPAFEKIVRGYSDKLYGILLRITGNPQDAEDALQDTFIRVFKGIRRLKSVDSFDVWLVRIAINVARSLVRKREPPYIPIENIEELVDGYADQPFHTMDRRALKTALEKAISELPVELKESFVLRDIEGMKVKEIAHILGISESLVKVRAHRARLLLRKKLLEYMKE
ncbi:RNA polymerase sigma factor [candidate division WOR-3 bacterium]|nr:RNA polymerase sigma factor [candidate division WOR-3 bacterium]